MKRTLVALTVAAAILQSPFVKAQDPQGTPSVTFQAEVTYVDVDVMVTDQQGNFVTGLTRDSFQVFEDGKPQKVEMFSYVEIPLERQSRYVFADKPVQVDTQSNRQPFAGRLY
jgi:hypothetical protein